MSLIDAAVSAFLQVALLGGVPFVIYLLYQRRRHGRTLRESARRAGLQLGEPRYLAYSAAFALVGVAAIIIWSPPLESLTRQGSAQRQFVGLGLGIHAVTLAVLNGVVQTAFAEELLFRGLVAGSLSRRLALAWGSRRRSSSSFRIWRFCVSRPSCGEFSLIVFAGALVWGWIRIKSGSIVGPWLMHASGNVTMALMVASRTTA